MPDVGEEDVHEWSRDTQKLAALSWISFLSACVFSMMFFAFVDPLVLVDALNVEFIEGRNSGYALGFFFLWANGWIAGWYTLRLVRRKRHPRSVGKRDGRARLTGGVDEGGDGRAHSARAERSVRGVRGVRLARVRGPESGRRSRAPRPPARGAPPRHRAAGWPR